jgi:3-deoxy-D-manno-octulosonic-acid transferase
VMALRREIPGCWFVVVPRHFERGEEVRQDLAALGFSPVLKTALDKAEPAPATGEHPCLIVNTTGELNGWYRLADLVFVGKTFLSGEGQNPVEPLLAGKPVITGPEMRNFGELFQRLREAGGVLRVERPEDLVQAARELLRDPERQRKMVAGGAAVVAADQGAAARSAEALLEQFDRGVN